MRKTLFILSSLLAFSTLKAQTAQIFTVRSAQVNAVSNQFMYENDTLKIAYNFWAPSGQMEFTITNKLSQPLYINWKSSALMLNGKKHNYYSESYTQTTKGKSGGYILSVPADGIAHNFQVGNSGSVTYIEKNDPVSFVLPNSGQTFHFSGLYNEFVYKMKKDAIAKEVPRTDNEEKTTRIKTSDFTEQNSPVTFRNFLTCSLNENGTSPFYLDHSFYVGNVTEMSYQQMMGKKTKTDDSKNYERPFRKPENFYMISDPQHILNKEAVD
jgi:hypothetical protein